MKVLSLIFIFLIPFVGFCQTKSITPIFSESQSFITQSHFKRIERDVHQNENEYAHQQFNKLFAEKFKHQDFDTSYNSVRRKNIFGHNYLNLDFLKNGARDTLVLDSVLEYSYTTLEDSILILRKSYEYNSIGFIVSRLISGLDTISDKLINEQRIEHYPNENGNDTLIIYLNWDKHYNKWTNNYKEKYFYDSDGRINFAQLWEWDKFSRTWVKREMIEEEYNDTGILISRASYIWNTSAEIWRGNNKWWSDTLTTATGYIESNIEFAWNTKIKDWDIVLRTDLAISNEENIEYEATYKWNRQDSSWVGELKTEYYFNALMYEQGLYYHTWDTEISDWVQTRKTIESFNDSWQLQNQSNYLWENEQWILLSKTENEYNDSNKRSRTTEMQRPDTLVFSKLINGLNSLDDIAGTGGENSCPNKTCLEPDTGLTAENSVIKWNYSINKSNFFQGYVQLEINNEISLKGDSAISLSFKNILPSNTWFDIILLDADGEEWLYSSNEILKDTDLKWKDMIFPFKNFKIPPNTLHANNKLDLHQVEKILLRIKLLSGIAANGLILLDNLGTFKVAKTDNWFTQSEEKFYYDENNNLIADTSFIWDSDENKLVPAHCGNYEYDENNNRIISELFSYSKTDDWIGELRSELEYNSENFETSRITYNWSMDSLDWIPDSKEISTYNQFNWQTSLETYVWNNNSNSWFLMSEEKQQFDEYGTQVLYSFLSFDIIDSTWYGYKNMMVLNINNEPIHDLYYEWNNLQNEWVLMKKYNRTKVENVIKNGLLMVSILKEWNETFSGWTPSRKMYYYYTNKQIGTIANQFHNKNRDIIVYPNPARDFIKIRLPENQITRMSVFNANGKLLLNKLLHSKTNTMETARLDPGLYFIRLETNGKTITKKILIIK